MRRLRVFALSLALMLLLMPMGCGRAKTEADGALDAASAQVDAYNEGYNVAFKALGQVNSPDKSPAHWKAVADSLAEAEAWMPKRKAALEAADTQWRKVSDMRGPDGARRCAALMREVVPLKLREEAKTSEILAAFRELSQYYASGNTTDAVAKEKWAALQKLDQEAVRISAEVYSKQKEASGYSEGNRSLFRTWDENPADY